MNSIKMGLALVFFSAIAGCSKIPLLSKTKTNQTSSSTTVVDHFGNKKCQKPIHCLEFAIQELAEARQEIQELEKRLEKRVEEAEAKVASVQTIATDGVNKANAAQSTANGAVKGIKYFTVDASKNTTKRIDYTNITFPERVDFIAIESIANDGNQMSQGRVMKRINDRTFQVRFVGMHPDGHRWIPHLKFTGIQIQK
ncbi:MAG: hypothetical protein AAGE84_09200 [Cyanobacteria bacterium P01_G01_bin.39]